MSTTQILLTVVLPLVLGVLGNLLTSVVKHLGAGVSRTYRAKLAQKAESRQELIAALAARKELATQYLLINWVGCMSLGVSAIVSMVGALVVREFSKGQNTVSLTLTAAATVIMFFLVAVFRNFESVYRGYLETTGAPRVALKTLMGDFTDRATG